MAALVETRLINDPYEDPGLLLDFRFGRHAVLFDIGDVRGLAPRTLQRVETVCVSHRHMDHFGGFDHFLSVRLYREGVIRFFGPPGLVEGVGAKLAGYSWNLLGASSPDLRLLVSDMDETGEVARAEFRAQEAFARRDLTPDLPAGVLREAEDHRLEYAVLDHGIPVLAFAIQESTGVSVIAEALTPLGLEVGPWLTAAKRAIRRGEPDEVLVETTSGPVTLGLLRQAALRVGPGQRVAYVTDTGLTLETHRRILALAAGADQLFIEAGFLHEDAAIAAERHHLTARQAGELAAEAGVGRVTPFHFSSRYAGREHELRTEVRAAFEAGQQG